MMFALGPATRIYLATGATDMRKGFEGLYGLVGDRLELDQRSGHMLVFANWQRTRFFLGCCASWLWTNWNRDMRVVPERRSALTETAGCPYLR